MFWLTSSCTPAAVSATSTPRAAGDLGHRLARRPRVEGHVAAEEVVGVEDAEQQIGVGDRRLGAALAVAGRARVGAGRLRPDLQQAEVVDPGERAAAGADLDQVDRRHGDREARALLEAVDAGDLEARSTARARACSMRQVLAVVPPMSKHSRRSSPRRRAYQAPASAPAAGPDSTRRIGSAGGVLGRHDAAVRQHHQHRAAEALVGAATSAARRGRARSTGIVAALQAVVTIRGYSRICGATSLDDAHRHAERVARGARRRSARWRGWRSSAGSRRRPPRPRPRASWLGERVEVGHGRALRRTSPSASRPLVELERRASRGTGGAGNSIWRSYMS